MESKLYLKEKEVEEMRMEMESLMKDNERLQREVLETQFRRDSNKEGKRSEGKVSKWEKRL